MSVKALFRKEWKQSKMYLLMITLLFIFLYPMRAILGLEEWRELTNQEYFMPEHAVPVVFGPGTSGMLIIIFLVLLAVQFIGTERNTRRHDFSFALPFKRRTMFFVKWLIGAGTTTIVMLITFTISYFLISTSEYGMYLEQSYFSLFLSPWLGYLAMYTFTLFIGTITGEMVSQIALTFIFTIFPIGIFVLIDSFLHLHGGEGYYQYYDALTLQLVWPHYILSGPFGIDDLHLWVPAVATIVFLSVGAWLYERNPSEHNGEFLLFKQLEPFFRVGIIACFALFGGMIVSSLVPFSLSNGTQILFYWIGFGLFLILSYLLTKRLFAMNIKVKGK